MSETRSLYLRTPGLAEAAETFLSSEVLRPGPLWIVDTVAHRFGVDDPDILLALALVLQAQERGHVGLDLLRASAALPIPEHILERERHEGTDPVPAPAWPEDPATWQQRVLDSGMVGPSGKPFVQGSYRFQGEERALILTQRMAREQQRLAEALMALASEAPSSRIGPDRVEVSVAALFPNETDGQGARALRAAAERCLTVITGGPGTGKTFSIKRLLAMLFEQAPEGLDLRVVLAAPTGKAAVRMTEAMGEGLAADLFSPAIRARLRKLPAQTVHKLLRIHPDTGATRYGPDEPLAVDVVVVDEASMLDLTLMRKLVEAVPKGARLVLLGDRDQLASVEAGTVLSDIVGGHFEGLEGPLHGRIVPFTVNHRFATAPTIAAVALAIQRRESAQLERAVALMAGDQQEPKETLKDRAFRLEPPEKNERPSEKLIEDLAEPYITGDGYAAELHQRISAGGSSALRSDHFELLKALERYRILAVHRRGPLGVSGLLRRVGDRVKTHILKAWRQRPARKGAEITAEKRTEEALPTRGGLWLGQPVLITKNAYDVDLRNGDIGLVLYSTDSKQGLVAVFPVTEAGTRTVREVPIARLPAHMGALAMTVHKSQGSQFDHVALVLADRKSPIQTRELVYTGVTRAMERVTWVGTKEALLEALNTPVGRVSGLGDVLWEQVDDSATQPGAMGALHPFIARHFPVDGSPVSRRVLNGAADDTWGLNRRKLDAILEAESRVVREDRSWKLLERAPVVVGSPLDRATQAVLAADRALLAREIRKAAGLSDEEWEAIRVPLYQQPAVEYVGVRKGARYMSKELFERRWAELERELEEARGAKPQERTLRAEFERRYWRLNER